MTDPSARVARLQFLAAGCIVLFWVLFPFIGSDLPERVRDFENNFLVPDLIWVAPLLVLGGLRLRRGDPLGLLWSAAAAGALVFLGLLDLVFNLRAGQYTASVGQGVANAVVNGGCIGFGLWCLGRLGHLLRAPSA